MTRQRVTVLGATGSVGQSALDVLGRQPDRFCVEVVTAHRDVEGLAKAARSSGARLAVIADRSAHAALADALAGTGVEVASGSVALRSAAAEPVDCVLAAIVGRAGLEPVWAAVEQGTRVALANKEALVCAGSLLRALAKTTGATLLPVDSEHSAIWQCFDFERPERVRRVIVTASGGPFRGWSREAMAAVTPAQAVAHPNWSMGAKISVDSATLMNKGLELIEAWHLFPVTADQLEVVVHPQSIVHSLVDYVDGSVLAQLGSPDLRTAIAVALAWPDRMTVPVEPLDLVATGCLDFEEADAANFPALGLAQAVLRHSPDSAVSLNAANEVAVEAFLRGQIGFLAIADVVKQTLDRHSAPAARSLDDVVALDEEARRIASGLVAATAS